ncbi:MAG TPA: hypothetical protein GX710_04415 [Clostridiales bacterium]|nr:hypothetical protein [Clostridiales bacterium]
MKRKIDFLKIIALTLVIFIIGTACRRLGENGVSINSADNSSNLESSKTTEAFMGETSTTESTETTKTSTDEKTATKPTKYTEREIVEAVCIDLYGFNESDNFSYADYMMNIAETLSERFLGEVISEEDAIEKARSILVETVGAEYIESIESEFVELDGEYIRYQRNKPPYTVTFYEEYNAWLIMPNLPSGITEDGRTFGVPGMSPYVIMHGLDGKVLAVFH